MNLLADLLPSTVTLPMAEGTVKCADNEGFAKPPATTMNDRF